jgi:hypothetical protein
MNRKIRRTLDYIELPWTLFTVLRMSKKQRAYAVNYINTMKVEWRKNSFPLQVTKWLASVL